MATYESVECFVFDPEKNYAVDVTCKFRVYEDDDCDHHEYELLSYEATNLEEVSHEDLSWIDFDYVESNYQLL